MADAFGRMFSSRKSGGGALVVKRRGKVLVDIWAGHADERGRRPFTRDTLAMAFSATKGITATVIHRLVDRGLLDYDAPIADRWPAFAAGNKARITLRQVLSHQAGLHSLRPLARHAGELYDHRAMETNLAACDADTARIDRPGYHALTFGWLLAGLARQVTGKGMGELYQTELAQPLGLDGLYLGVPAGQRHRAAEPTGFLSRLVPIGRLDAPLRRIEPVRPLVDAIYLPGMDKFPRHAGNHDTEMPAGNGYFTADALATVYGAIANGGAPLFSTARVEEIGRVQTRARDFVMGVRPHWRLGYHRTVTVGGTFSPTAFGHNGYGGPGGWADPASGLSFGFVTNNLNWYTTAIGDRRTFSLSGLALACAKRLD